MARIDKNLIILCAGVSITLAFMLLNRIYNGFGPYLDFGLFNLSFQKISHYGELSRAAFGHLQPSIIILSFLGYIFPWEWQIFLPVFILFFINPLMLFSIYGWSAVVLYLLIPITWFIYLDIFILEIFFFPIVLLTIKFFEEEKIQKFLWLIVCGLLVKESFLFVVAGFFLISIVTRRKKIASLTLFITIFYVCVFYFLSSTSDPFFEKFGEYEVNFFEFQWLKAWNWVEVAKTAFIFIGPFVFFKFRFSFFLISLIPFISFTVVSDKEYLLFYSNQYLFMFLPFFLHDLSKVLEIQNSSKQIFWAFMAAVAVGFGGSPISRFFYSEKIASLNYESFFPKRADMVVNVDKAFSCLANTDGYYSIQNNSFWPVEGLHNDFLLFPSGVNSFAFVPKFLGLSMSFEEVKADGVVLRPDVETFLYDQSCGFFYGRCTNDEVVSEYRAVRDDTINRSVGSFLVGGYEFHFFSGPLAFEFKQCIDS